MATKKVGYIPTTQVSGRVGNTSYSNGEVSKITGTGGRNLRDEGYPNTYYSSPSTSSGNGSFGSYYMSKVGNTKTGGSTGGSSGGRSGASASAGSSSNMANAYNALLAAYRQNDYSDYLAQMRAAAQSAYDRGMSALNSAYDNQLSSLSNNLNETRNQLANQYNRSKQNIADDAAASLKQAYINKLQSERNLGQQMSAQGLTGGATETTMANMLNNYGNARNEINTTQNRNLSNLEGNYSDNLSQAMQAYNSAVANANLQKAQQAMQLENALANNQISALGDYQSLMQRENQNYLDLLKAAISNGASFNYTPTEANNGFNAIAVNQASMPTSSNYNAALQALMNAQQTPGSGAAISLSNPVTQGNALAEFIKALQG